MKKLAVYFGLFAGMCVIFTTCYYLSYKRALKQFMEQTSERDYQLLMELRNAQMADNAFIQENDIVEDSGQSATLPEDEILEVGLNDIETIKPQTKFIVESYNVTTNELLKEELSLPGEYVGLTREEVINKLSEYMNDLSVSEYEKGLFAYELLSFSKDSVTMRKSYNKDLVKFKYYIAVRDGYVIVYYSDLKTVYEYTKILAVDLPEVERERLMQGIYLNTNAELYELLESYSS